MHTLFICQTLGLKIIRRHQFKKKDTRIDYLTFIFVQKLDFVSAYKKIENIYQQLFQTPRLKFLLDGIPEPSLI